jgi:methylated-DNA-[protein]-cysteine S-methyltransferase
MDNVKYREDGTPVIVVPFKLRHLGYKQTIVVDEQNRMTAMQIRRISESVVLQCEQMGRSPSVEEVQDMVEHQIMAFLRGERRQLDFPIRMVGTPFQQRVWQALQQIPYGATRTYGAIATAIGNPRASRAVGMACNKNPLLLIVPCHRVVGANGKLVGFAYGTEAKRRLLELEVK